MSSMCYHELRSAHDAERALAGVELLAHAQIGDDDVSAVRQQDVLHLQVAVDDVHGVEMLQGHHNLR